jgi:phosphoribosylglycinamide formyltransferase-1
LSSGFHPHFALVLAMTRIAIFASGAGSNAAKIIEFFKHHDSIGVVLVVSNKPEARVLNIAAGAGIPTMIIDKEEFFRGSGYVPELKERHIDFIVLAGFLWKIPLSLIEAYPNSIINIHPALLPAYGGKGMFGMNVHRAVIEAGEPQSGITIHFVDEHYDNGDIIFQDRFNISPGDTPESLAQKIHELEYAHFPVIIEQVINLQNQR